MTDATSFEVIPAIDVTDGEVVQLVGGERGTGETYGDPAEAARRWLEAGATRLHVVDLDGAFEGDRHNAAAIEAIVDAVDIPVQLGGGIRTEADGSALLEAGVDRIILGTAAMKNPDLVESLATSYPERVIVSLDASDGEVVVEGWTAGTGVSPEKAAKRFTDVAIGGILCTDIDVEGRLAGVRADRLSSIVESVDVPVIASGGIATLKDIRTVVESGAAAAVVGTALYEDAFCLADAQSAAQSAAAARSQE